MPNYSNTDPDAGAPGNKCRPWSDSWHRYNAAYEWKVLTAGPGYLYALQRQSDKAIKIGMSATPRKRFIQYCSSYPACRDKYRLLWTVTVDRMRESEREAHGLLRPFRVGGEFFSIDTLRAFHVLLLFGVPAAAGLPYQNPSHYWRPKL